VFQLKGEFYCMASCEEILDALHSNSSVYVLHQLLCIRKVHVREFFLHLSEILQN